MLHDRSQLYDWRLRTPSAYLCVAVAAAVAAAAVATAVATATLPAALAAAAALAAPTASTAARRPAVTERAAAHGARGARAHRRAAA